MTLRRRLALLSGGAVAVTILLASAIVYVLVRDNLRNQVDEDLREQAQRTTVRPDGVPPTAGAPVPAPVAGGDGRGRGEDGAIALPPPAPGGPSGIGQLIRPDGAVIRAPGEDFQIPVSRSDLELAVAGGEPRYEDVEAHHTKLRVLTQPLPGGGALQVAASLHDTEETLSALVLVLLLVSAGGVALAAALGPIVARTALAPAGEVSDAAVEVARTHDLTRRIEVRGDDELGRLAASFNEMMEGLGRSEAAQRRLVADASHELRTPLATLRTNIETLGRAEGLSGRERELLIGDVTDELEEMTGLVADIVELAREPGANRVSPQDVRLDHLAAEAVERARRRARGLAFTERLQPTLVTGDPARIGRAISNLLDNATKWSPDGGEVEVETAGGRVRIRDHGPGFKDEDLPKVFDRFWRSDEARGTPGSGLGLAIVQRVAEEHGGTAAAANAAGGGAAVEIAFPEEPLDPQEGS